MENTKEDNKLYIQNSKISIDNFILKNDYRNAYTMLILVLKRLDHNQRVEIIDYYSKNMYDLILGISHLHDMHST